MQGRKAESVVCYCAAFWGHCQLHGKSAKYAFDGFLNISFEVEDIFVGILQERVWLHS